MLRLIAGFLLAAGASAASAHGGVEHAEHLGWTWDAQITIPLALLLATFLVGRARLSQRSRTKVPGTWQFLAGWAVLALSLVSPLHSGGERSFTLHMIEHELIMLVATLLLAASHSGGTLAWGLPPSLRRSLGGGWKSPLAALWRRLTEPVTATLVQGVVMWVWHAPALFNRTLQSDVWHAAQHLSFVLASLLFWCAMLGRRSSFGVSAACLFITSLIGGALGALMTFSQSPWYAGYAAMNLSGIGLDPVRDQQLAGLLMWIPGGLVHAGAALAMLYKWLVVSEGSHALRTS